MKVLTLGHPDLYKRSAEVKDFGSSALKKDINALKKAMKELGGMGIAAPQLGIDRRLILIQSRPNKRYPHAPKSDLMILINPTFEESKDSCEDWEGCLSVPGLRGLVRRATQVSVNYKSFDAEEVSSCFNDFIARIFLHEFDHLEGMTFVDRVESVRHLISEQEYFNQFT